MTEVTIAPPVAADKADWRRLFDGYTIFYKRQPNDMVAETVWSWIHDPAHVFEALVAKSAEGRVVGIAHFRGMPRPATASTACFLDDLFVDPEFRGGRIATRLINAVGDLARQRGWTVMRWTTADDNYRARTAYDRLAKRTMWITYEMDLSPT
jgi:GNAT superfamily N-acetyltransferase